MPHHVKEHAPAGKPSNTGLRVREDIVMIQEILCQNEQAILSDCLSQLNNSDWKRQMGFQVHWVETCLTILLTDFLRYV